METLCGRKNNPTAAIIEQDGKVFYFDKHGNELKDGDTIRYDSGKMEKLFLTADGELGIDATNPSWIRSGRAIPCEYGIYPLDHASMKEIEKADTEK